MLVKRVFDVAVSLFGLIILSPLLLVVAVLVGLGGGDIIFSQERVGKEGALFRIFKFRTMAAEIPGTSLITVGRDPRITRVGAFLRKWKLDELPQLFNVLVGDMSIVGPRPEVPRYVAYYPEDVRKIVLSVRPGITDLASIAFRDESALLGRAADPEQVYVETILPIKLQHYLRYVRERSLALDIRIIVKTIFAVMV